jgi:peptide deformylase
MSKLKIVEFDEKALRQPTHTVDVPLSDSLKELTATMIALMITHEGVGLAAPQVNRPECIFVANLSDGYHIFVNPTITEYSEAQGTEKEGCLSLPGVTVAVRRSKFIRVTYADASGQLFENKKFKRHDARIIQHEVDHLNQRLISDYAKKIKPSISETA